jgi:hypothetical protein
VQTLSCELQKWCHCDLVSMIADCHGAEYEDGCFLGCCSLVETDRCFRGVYCPHHFIALMMHQLLLDYTLQHPESRHLDSESSVLA